MANSSITTGAGERGVKKNQCSHARTWEIITYLISISLYRRGRIPRTCLYSKPRKLKKSSSFSGIQSFE
jgi:hypothetical protein